MAYSEEDVRRRIISHMNADHSDSLVNLNVAPILSGKVARYVENYANVSRFRSASAEIKDVDISKMTIYAGNRPYYVYFIPPLADLKEARERLVQMDKESLKRLNRSSVTLKAYLPPKKPFHVFMFGMLLGFYMLYSRKDNLYPGSTPYELIFKHLPKFTDFAIWARPFVFYPVLGIHIVEVVFMTFKLEKHSMPLFSKAWWAWIASTFIEGVGAFQRIGEYVALKEKETHH